LVRKEKTMKFALSLLGALIVTAAIGTPAHADGSMVRLLQRAFLRHQLRLPHL
jgi:hypothetical protein